jgi:large subunit ribosomal protein L25
LDTDPVTNGLIHVDFLAVQANVKVTASVAIIMEGVAPAVKEAVGRVELVKDHVMVQALPRDLPHDIKVDVSGLATLQDGIFVSDLKVGKNVEILEDADLPIVAVVAIEDEAEEVSTSADAAGNATAAAIAAEKTKK